jgi:hypothetical protein
MFVAGTLVTSTGWESGVPVAGKDVEVAAPVPGSGEPQASAASKSKTTNTTKLFRG